MNEKRYGKKVDDVDDTIINITEDGNDFAWFLSDDYTDEQVDKIVQRLNELSDENNLLKLQNQEIEIALLNNQLAYNDLQKENEQLKYENKNLKSNIDDLLDNELEDRDTVCGAGKFRLEEWGKHRYHQFYNGDEELEDETVVFMLMDLTKENRELKQYIKEIDDAELHLKNIILKRINDYIWEWDDEGTPVSQVLRELKEEIK